MAEISPSQKWSISYLWEHFLVPEHRIPIRLSLECVQNAADHQSCHTCTRTEPILQIQRTLEFENCDTCTRTEPILQMQGTLEFESCDTCTRTEPILQTQRILKLESCDTCTRTEPIWIHGLSMATANC